MKVISKEHSFVLCFLCSYDQKITSKVYFLKTLLSIAKIESTFLKLWLCAVNGSGGNTCDIPFIDDPLSFRKGNR